MGLVTSPSDVSWRLAAFAIVAACGATAGGAQAVAQADGKDGRKQKRPSLSLNLSPRMGIAPALVTATAEIKGGSDNFEEYYCASVQWDWDDGSLSESTTDCAPYDRNGSEIRRRFTAQHRFVRSGSYRVTFRLKQKDKVVASTSAVVRFSGGDAFDD